MGQHSKLFVGGLSAQTTTEALRGHFVKYGRLVDAVVMSKNGRPRGFGFVSFDAAAGAAAALSEAQWLDGRFVDVKRAVPGEHTQERASNKIFVGGLPQDACTEDLKACFAGYGPVADAVVMVDRRTKRSRGFGFVRFANGLQGAAAAEAVLVDAADHRLGGKWVEVKRATPAALLQELSPRSSGTNSASCTPTSVALAEQQEQARLYFECLSAAGWDAFLGLPDAVAPGGFGAGTAAVAGLKGHARGRRGRRSRRAGEDFGWADEEGSGACDQGNYWHRHCLELGSGAMEWPASSCDAAGMMQPFGVELPGFDHAALSASATGSSELDEECFLADFGSALPELEEPPAAGCESARASWRENDPGLANRAVSPPPGLGMDASPMKVRCRIGSLDAVVSNERFEGFTREDFLSMEVRPWLSAW